MKHRLLRTVIALAMAALLAAWAASLGLAQMGQFRVVAHSDAGEAQAVKRAVVRQLLADADGDAGQLLRWAAEEPDVLTARAKAVAHRAHAQGLGPAPQVALHQRDRLPLRMGPVYLPVTLSHPQATLVLGEGSGANWWCLIFSYLCVAASDSLPGEEEEREEVMTSLPGSGDAARSDRPLHMLWEQDKGDALPQAAPRMVLWEWLNRWRSRAADDTTASLLSGP